MNRSDLPLDPVQRAAHYNQHPSGVECIQIVRDLPFNLGNMVKYMYRWRQKGSPLQDLEKAYWYLHDEFVRMERARAEFVIPITYATHLLPLGHGLVGTTPIATYVKLVDRVRTAELAEIAARPVPTWGGSPLVVWAERMIDLLLSWREGYDHRVLDRHGEALFQHTEMAIQAEIVAMKRTAAAAIAKEIG